MGLAQRSKEMTVRIDANLPPNPPTSHQMGITPLPIPEVIDPYAPTDTSPSFVQPLDQNKSVMSSRSIMNIDPMVNRPPDITSEGADLWVESGTHSTVNPVEIPHSSLPSKPIVSPTDVVRGLNALRSPRWDPDETLRPERLREVTDADVIVLTAAATRDISPSDDALQARLQVGRSRLSQIFNDLRRHGFLSVRKEGRTRWYRMTAAASQLLTEVEV